MKIGLLSFAIMFHVLDIAVVVAADQTNASLKAKFDGAASVTISGRIGSAVKFVGKQWAGTFETKDGTSIQRIRGSIFDNTTWSKIPGEPDALNLRMTANAVSITIKKQNGSVEKLALISNQCLVSIEGWHEALSGKDVFGELAKIVIAE